MTLPQLLKTEINMLDIQRKTTLIAIQREAIRPIFSLKVKWRQDDVVPKTSSFNRSLVNLFCFACLLSFQTKSKKDNTKEMKLKFKKRKTGKRNSKHANSILEYDISKKAVFYYSIDLQLTNSNVVSLGKYGCYYVLYSVIYLECYTWIVSACLC